MRDCHSFSTDDRLSPPPAGRQPTADRSRLSIRTGHVKKVRQTFFRDFFGMYELLPRQAGTREDRGVQRLKGSGLRAEARRSAEMAMNSIIDVSNPTIPHHRVEVRVRSNERKPRSQQRVSAKKSRRNEMFVFGVT
jgi:hypothetical protein